MKVYVWNILWSFVLVSDKLRTVWTQVHFGGIVSGASQNLEEWNLSKILSDNQKATASKSHKCQKAIETKSHLVKKPLFWNTKMPCLTQKMREGTMTACNTFWKAWHIILYICGILILSGMLYLILHLKQLLYEGKKFYIDFCSIKNFPWTWSFIRILGRLWMVTFCLRNI